MTGLYFKEHVMRGIVFVVAAVLLAPIGLHADQAHGGGAAFAPAAELAPAAWSQEDPADSLYRAARAAMSDGDYERAAGLFHRIWHRHPDSSYAPDAPYWEAFNRYRMGESEDLEEARELLELQAERYAEAPTLRSGDARALSARIAGMLARRGDQSAAQSIVVAANEIAGIGAQVGAEVAAQMEVMAQELAAQGELMGREGALALERAGAAIDQAIVRGAFHGGSGDIPEHCREQAETQLAALNALLHMNADRAMPVLEKVMERRDECSVPVRRRAVFLIADKRSPRTVDLLLDIAREDPDLEVRRQAVFWLSEVEDPRAVEALDRFLQESDDERIRERALFALSQHDGPRARQILRRVAGDASMPVRLRSKAIFWLGNDGSEEDLDFLKGMFGRYDDPELNERILFTVGQAERGEDARWLLSVAADEDVPTQLRRTAIFWAADAGAPARDLGAVYDRLDDRELKERILFGLSQSSQPAAIDKLIEIARSEQDAELRKRAIFWLGNSNDERAADVLMELLTNPQGGGR